MNDRYPPILAEATADDILAVLRDSHRQQCTHDPEANPDISLTHESTIAEWRDACDLLPWIKVAEAMNGYWSVSIPREQWREVLEPPKQRALRGVCELVARQAKLRRIRPAGILGSNCIPAGAFLTIRSYLAQAGADVSDVGPSTPLREYTRRYPGVFLGPVSQLAPGILPLVKIRTPVYDAFIFGMLVAWVGMLVGWCSGSLGIGILAVLLFAMCYLGVWTIGRWVLPASVEFRGLETFRDLSKLIAASART
ncbi:MAG: hypothetical protein U0805_08120 [Pirellulales bacterium]